MLKPILECMQSTRAATILSAFLKSGATKLLFARDPIQMLWAPEARAYYTCALSSSRALPRDKNCFGPLPLAGMASFLLNCAFFVAILCTSALFWPSEWIKKEGGRHLTFR